VAAKIDVSYGITNPGGRGLIVGGELTIVRGAIP
jgi:hypothetical protein